MALHLLGTRIGVSPKAARTRTMPPRARWLSLVFQRPHTCGRLGIRPPGHGVATDLTHDRLIRLQHPIHNGPILFAPTRRAEPLAQGLDLVEVLLDLVGLAPGSHPSLLHVTVSRGLQRSPSGVVPPPCTVNAANRSLLSANNKGLLQPHVSHCVFP